LFQHALKEADQTARNTRDECDRFAQTPLDHPCELPVPVGLERHIEGRKKVGFPEVLVSAERHPALEFVD
jgi:hypothetical protein